jgi:SSS family solute:Na+ symporter
MGVSTGVYITISLLNKKPDFNMDKLLHRGIYGVKEDSVVVDIKPAKKFKLFGITKEFTKLDKAIYYTAYGWTFLWVFVFIIGTIMNLTSDVSDFSWLTFWKYYILINLAISIVIVTWFIIGGSRDLKKMFSRLRTMTRDDSDNGMVSEETSK